MKTVIVADKNGQAGNQLYLFAHFISNAIEYKYRLYFPAFNELSVYFEKASLNQYDNFPIYSRVSRFDFINRTFLYFFRFAVAILYRTLPKSKWHSIIRLYLLNDLKNDPYEYYNMETETEYLVNKPLLILQGWSFRSPQCVVRQKNIVRSFFHLKEPMRKKINEIIINFRKESDVLIGVHIRRGDYTKFMKGIYYYDNAVYEKYMQQASELFPDKKIGFVICSNENVSVNHPAGSKILYPRGHFMEDLYTLADCDYLIGPPSTFSQWASYYGNKPLKILFKSDQSALHLEEFVVAPL